MANGSEQFWWAAWAFTTTFAGTLLFSGGLLLWTAESTLWSVIAISVPGALIGSFAGRVVWMVRQGLRADAVKRPRSAERYFC